MSILGRMIRRLKQDTGQALIEYILVLPVIFLLIVNCVNFGGFFYAWITVTNAARAGADYAVMGLASAGGPTVGTGATIDSMIAADVSALPNTSTRLTVNVCRTLYNGTTTTTTTVYGTCGSSIPTDPETGLFTLTSVDVTYTWQPFISVFSFPKLGVYMTLPPTTIRKVAVMRTIN